jgi:hypothetical protein
MIKSRMYSRNGVWYCRRMGVVGSGATPEQAWDDMWTLYREAVRPQERAFTRVRA